MARRIINGTDQTELIAGYANLAAILRALWSNMDGPVAGGWE